MDASELDFLEEMLHANELLRCANCDEETLHAHEEVLESWPHATELRMRCTCCGTSGMWLQAHGAQAKQTGCSRPKMQGAYLKWNEHYFNVPVGTAVARVSITFE